MDYNDNDNEGRNLRLTGEDSSKIPSVLRPFTLPKFDFDDNLHGHLRFDSLVENEAFLGIPSQEDNQWIEDFSRAGNGIEFNPSAAESCSLHSHVNVWSEATSSESVEMLLKAVVQEETVRDGSLLQESESLSEQGTTTNKMDNQLSNDGKTADPYNENALLPSIDAVGSFSVITCDSGVAGALAENILLAQNSDLASHVVHGGGEKSDVSLVTTSSDTKREDSDHRETAAMVNESDFFQTTNKIHENTNVESSSQEFDTPVECTEQDRNGGTSLEKNVPDSVSENLYGYDKNDNRTLTDHTERDLPIEILSKMNSPKEESCVEMPVFISEEASSSLVKGEDSVSAVGTIDDVVIHFEHAGSFSSGTILPMQSSSTEAKQLSGVSSVMVENSNISVVGGIDEPGICTNAELLEAPISKPFEGNNNSLEVRHLSITCRFLDQMDSNKVTDPIKPKESNVAGECCGEKLVTDIEEVLLDNAAIPKERTLGHDHDLSIDKAVSLDPFDVVKKDVDPLRKEVEDETDIILHPVDSEVDGQKSTSDADVAELIDATGTNLLSSQSENRDRADELLSLTDKLPMTSDSMDYTRSHDFASTAEPENVSKCEVAGDIMENYQANYLLEASNVFVPGDPCDELLDEKIEKSDNPSVVLTEGEGEVEVVAVAAETDKTLEEETEANAEKKISSSLVEVDNITKDTLHEASCVESFVEVDNLKSNEHENVDEVLMMSESSRVDLPAQPGDTSILNTVPLGPESEGGSGKTGEQSSGSHDAEGLPADIVTNFSSPNAGLGSSMEGARSPYGRKSRRPSSKSGKGSGKKTSQVGEATPVRQNEKRDNALPFSSPLGSGQLMNFYSTMKPGGHFSIPASGLPDLNTSTPPSVYFLQPFTDLQQLQLRAQIIVYGSLIQGTAPDEAYMVSAFDGGRNIWEPSWRACVDRLLLGKSKSTIAELLPSRSDTKVPDQTQSQTFSESEVTPHVASRARNKGISSPMIPASSTLWAMSTLSSEVPPTSTAKCALPDYPVVSPLGPYQTQVMRNYATDSSRQAQAPFPVPWITPSQSSFNISTNYPVFSITTPAKPSSMKEPLPIGLGSKQVSPISTTQASGVSDVFVGPSSRDLKKLKVSSEHSADKITTKPKKSSGPDAAQQVFVNAPSLDTNFTAIVDNQPSKVVPVAGDSGQISFIPCNQADPVHTPAVASLYSTSVTVTAPMYLTKSNTNQIFSLISPLIAGDSLKKPDLTVDNRSILLEGFNKVEEAKLQAQEAGANSAIAISYLESVWSQIRQLSNSGLNLDSESKLASAAAAIAAAASVAKAAAAAARIAADVAVQAKQMSEEAISLSVAANNREFGSGPVLNAVNNPPSLAISAAREAARKRIEAASAATRHAANLDAILKAAELASEAVSHAGKIVSMADPFSLTQLVEAGPNEYWKDLHLEPFPVAKLNVKKSSTSLDDDSIFKMGDDTARAAVVNSDNDIQMVSGTLDASSMKEGSNVEVLRDFGDSKKAWFSATVLALKDGEALLCYTDVSSGSEQLKEWVSLEAKVETGDAFIPRARIPHRMTSVNFERTRKRQRDATKDYNWSVGDKVDAWLQNCWCEGVVAEKNKKDGTVLMINLLDQGENVPVKVWHLRPTLVWNGDQWVEWSRSQQNDALKGDTPAPKRSKVLTNIGETKEKGKTIDPAAGTARTEELTLPLSANEKLFSTGSTADEKKHKVIRGTRWGLEKEGSRVVFGVPKPGKKRKFMEVSKHYVSEQSAKANVPSNSVNKSAKAAVHQVSGLPSSRNNSKADQRESKHRAPFRFGKPIISNASRTSSQKDDSSASSQPNEGDDSVSDHVGKGNENEAGDKMIAESSTMVASHEETSGEATMVFPSEDLPQLNSKKGPRSVIPERRRFPVPTGRLGKTESNENSEVAEPRRSVRRIQPTSRLLEGLQSSLITSKISASSSHDKSHRGGPNKVSTKGASTGTGNRG